MSRQKDYILIGDINSTLDKLVSYTDIEMDNAVIEDKLDDVKVRRIAAERVTIKRVRNIFNEMLKDINKEG